VARLPEYYLEGYARSDRVRVQEALAEAAIGISQLEGETKIRSTRQREQPFIKLEALQSKNGEFRRDAEAILARTPGTISPEEASEAASKLRTALKNQNRDALSPWTRTKIALMESSDPIPILDRILTAFPELHFYRVFPTELLQNRLDAWQLFEHCDNQGKSIPEVGRYIRHVGFDAVYGSNAIWPAMFICGPLVALDHPFAIVLNTNIGSQIIGGQAKPMTRDLKGWDWPTGIPTLHLGSARSLAQSELEIGWGPNGAKRLLDSLVSGANTTIELFTDPDKWIDDEGLIDTEDRLIAWSSLQWGLETVMQLGQEWSSPESTWTAFRALQMLDGVWLRGKEKFSLDSVLDPANIRQYALPAISNKAYEAWAAQIVDWYEEELTKIRPYGKFTPSQTIEDVRNLLHGTGVQSNRKGPSARGRRIAALRSIREITLKPIKYIAMFWWAGVILSPKTNANPLNQLEFLRASRRSDTSQ
jgi:hypothetical protein